MFTRVAVVVRNCTLTVFVALFLTASIGCPTGPTLPVIGLSSTALTFSAVEFGANPQSQTVQLTNAGVDSLDWTCTDNADWLSLTPDSGSATTDTVDLTVNVDTVGLTPAGSPYSGTITVAAPGASNSPREITVTLTMTGRTCESWSGTVDSDTTLTAGCYLVESSASVGNGATLTINPGVTLIFQQNEEMSVHETGKLSAVGTAEQPILITGAEPIRGYWGGLRFYMSNSVENRLDHVTIEYGGGYWDANLYLDGRSSSPSRVNITNCTLQESGSYGFYFSDAVVEQFSGNTITTNTSGAGDVSGNDAGFLDDTSTFTGNDLDVVRIWGSTVDTDRTWPGIDADYLIAGSIGVSDAQLTIAPGARLLFEQGEEMSIHEDGKLSAVGTVDRPILFGGVEETNGYWGGLRFYLSNSTDNRLAHVTIEYGGGYWGANLYLDGRSRSPARVNVTDCTLSGSSSYGFHFSDAIVEEFTGNTITSNTLGAGNVSGNDAGYLDDTSTFTGNDLDVVRIWGSTVGADRTWPGIDADYLIAGSVGVSDALLTIEPGARLVFEQGEEMTIDDDGRLSARGTEESPIVFTGAESTRGYWGGVRFYLSNSAENALDYVTIEYGGGYWDANLLLDGRSWSPVQIEVTNCTISESGSWGIRMNDTNANADIETANTFSGNTSGDVFQE